MAAGLIKGRGGIRGRLPAVALIGLGLAALYEASSLPFGTVRQPDSGFYPILVSIALVVFGAVAAAEATPSSPNETPAVAGAQARVWLAIFALAAYAWAVAPIGFILCTAALLVLLLRGIGRVRWSASMAAAMLASVACYSLFTKLGMPLPAGLLRF